MVVTARAGVEPRAEAGASELVAWARGQQGKEGRFRVYSDDRAEFADRWAGSWGGGGVMGVQLSLGEWRAGR